MIIKKDKSDIQNFLSDSANYKGNCDAVYFPESEIEVIEAVKTANSENKKITVAGNGTGLTGARVPDEGIVISMEKLNRIISFDKNNRIAVLEPGVILEDFTSKAKESGLLYPPDPTETTGFIGGNVATNASGAKTFKYGPTRNYVEGLRIVLSDGEVLNLNRGKFIAEGFTLKLTTESGKEIVINLPEYEMPKSSKNAAGYYSRFNMDAVDLFIGSEGTLGIITQITLRLLEYPDKILSSIVFFNSQKNALNFVKEARERSYSSRSAGRDNEFDARGLEFFDNYSLNFLKDDYSHIPANAEAAVWFEQEYTDDNEERMFGDWMELIEKCGGSEESAWFAADENSRAKFKEFRHAVSWKVSEYVNRNNLLKLGTDTAVPDEYFEEFYKYSRSIVEEKGINFIVYGHFGNSHIHLNMLPKSTDQYEICKDLYLLICRKAIELGGTISAEHGIGKIKKEYLLEMYGPSKIEQMVNVKKTLDPNLILGIGNIFYQEFLN